MTRTDDAGRYRPQLSGQGCGRRIVLATNNDGKIREMADLLQKTGFTVIAQNTLHVPDVAENAPTFVENALLKARQAAYHTSDPVVADDSGLEVDALGLAPGVKSSRFAGEHATDEDNIAKLLAAMENIPDPLRTARFQCVMVYLRHAANPTPVICTGTWPGRILRSPRGTGGFGYDPVFWVPDHDCSAAELSITDKKKISHRGQALARLVALLANDKLPV